MAGMTQAELDALLAQYGGEVGGPGKGRREIPGAKVPGVYEGTDVPISGGKPGPPQYNIETPRGNIVVEPQADGTYQLVSAPNAPTTTARGTEGGAPYIVNGQIYDPTTQTMKPIEGYQPPRLAPVNAGPEGSRIFDPNTNQTTNIPPSATWIQQQADAQAAAEAKQAIDAMNFFRQQQADQISAMVSQGTLSETQASNIWSRMSDVFVNWPKAVGAEARATEATRQTGAANAGRYGLDVAGEARLQGDAAAKDAQYLAEHTAVGTGYSGMPDLEGARQRTAAALYNRMPDYQALLGQQPQLPYYGADELAQTQSLAMPYIFGGGGGGGTAPAPAPQPPAYTYNPAPAPQPAYPPAADETDPRRNPWTRLMSGGY